MGVTRASGTIRQSKRKAECRLGVMTARSRGMKPQARSEKRGFELSDYSRVVLGEITSAVSGYK